MAIASASNVVQMTGDDLYKISYTPTKAGVGNAIRGYPLVYILESLFFRYEVANWCSDAEGFQQYSFSRGIWAQHEQVATNVAKAIAAHAFTTAPTGIIESSYEALITNPSVDRFLADCSNVVDYSSLPCATATQPSPGDVLSPSYLMALEGTLPYLTAVAYQSGPSPTGGTILSSSGDFSEYADGLPEWGYSSYNAPKNLFFDEVQYEVWTGPDPNSEIGAYPFRGGAASPVESVTCYLGLSAKYSGAGGAATETKFFRYPVTATREEYRAVFNGVDFGKKLIQAVADHFGWSLIVPERGEYGDGITLSLSVVYPGTSCLVVKFKDL